MTLQGRDHGDKAYRWETLFERYTDFLYQAGIIDKRQFRHLSEMVECEIELHRAKSAKKYQETALEDTVRRCEEAERYVARAPKPPPAGFVRIGYRPLPERYEQKTA
jgi:hypothetical protein